MATGDSANNFGMIELTDRDEEILAIFAKLSEGSQDRGFELLPGADGLGSPPWPEGKIGPTRDEIRSLVNREFLEADKSAAPAWRFWPSAQARERFADAAEQALGQALTDPDQRLAVILRAVVDAFEQDPATPLLLLRTDSDDIVRHPAWGIPPDVVRLHDLRQLEELGLVGWEDNTRFYPTPSGRMAVRNPAALLSQRADQTQDEEERSRLQHWVEKIRAGDVAVGAASGLTGAVVRALLGF
jgi:hypothetical protein